MRCLSVSLVVIAALAVCAFSVTEALTTKVEPKTRVCFTEEVGPEIPLSFQWACTAGGKLDLNADVYDSTGRKLHSWLSATEGHYSVHGDRSNTHFKFCFSNEMAMFTPKWVNFNFVKGHHPSAARKDALDPIEV